MSEDFRSLSEQIIRGAEQSQKSAADLQARLSRVEEEFDSYRAATRGAMDAKDREVEELLAELAQARQQVNDTLSEHQETKAHLDTQIQRAVALSAQRLVAEKQEVEAKHHLERVERQRISEVDAKDKEIEALQKKVRSLTLELEEASAEKRVVIRDPTDDEFAALRQQLEDVKAQSVFDIERAKMSEQSAREARETLSRRVAELEKLLTQRDELIDELQKPRKVETPEKDQTISRLNKELEKAQEEVRSQSARYTSVSGLKSERDQDVVDLRRQLSAEQASHQATKAAQLAEKEIRHANSAKIERLERRITQLEQELQDEQERRQRDAALKPFGRS